MRPNFLFIGPDKTGSTWIFEYLNRHEQCFVPQCKDIYFFDREYERGLDWYFRFFAPATSKQKAIGELSHDYILSSTVALRIFNDLPSVNLIASLRNPAERTFSQYLYMVRSGITRKKFREALADYPFLVRNSMYFDLLSPYYDLFDSRQILLLRFEDLKTDKQKFADELCDHLGIERRSAEDVGIVRAAAKPRSYLVSKILRNGASMARSMGMLSLVGYIKHSRIIEYLYKPYSESDRPTLSLDDRKYLNEIFEKQVISLEKLTGQSFSNWMNGENG